MQLRTRLVCSVVAAAAVMLGPVAPSASAAATWRIQTVSALPGGGEFHAADCPTATFCLAVGMYGEAGPGYQLVERWDGTKWTFVPTPGGNSSAQTMFTGVSCSSASACTAVGFVLPDDGVYHERPLIVRWNGTKWTTQTPAIPPGNPEGSFFSVACATTSSCFATSSFGVERWNGTKWSIQSLPAGSAVSGGITCLSGSNCLATGSQYGKAVILRWNGAKWSVQQVQPVPGGRTAELGALDCASASSCFAVGSSYASGSDERRLVERWNGTAWSIVFTPLPAGQANGKFNAVACRKNSTCILAGFTGTYSSARTLVERWNGSALVIEPTPNKGGANTLAGAACDLVKSCIAVGTSDQIGEPKPLVERNP